MKEFEQVQNDICLLVKGWEARLSGIHKDVLHTRRNRQNRTIKQIVGHLIDSASNNLHRTVHLQYQPSPIGFPDYANLGANDTWIAVQKYEKEDWDLLVQLFKYTNLHLVHVIGCIREEALGNIWISALGEEISLFEMIVDYPRHLKLHLLEIEELINMGPLLAASSISGEKTAKSDIPQSDFYAAKLLYEIDSWDLAELLKNNEGVVVVDTRSREAYAAGHIPSSLNLPHRTISPESTRQMDPSKTYVTYCDGIGCNASTKGALNLARLGFSVRELLGGLDWWKRDGYPIEGLRVTAAGGLACGCS